MRRLQILITLLFVTLIASSQSAFADTPSAERQLVYALEVYEGYGYAATYAPLNEEVIYLIADHDNALSPRYTMVYYWPLTQSYRADWETLNEPVTTATIEVSHSGDVIKIEESTVFSVEFPNGYGYRDSSLYWGSDAEDVFQRTYEERLNYYSELGEYQNASQEYQQLYEEYLDAMLDESIIQKPLAPEKPQELEPYLNVVTPPTIGFRLNLPIGRYQIRLRDADGEIIPGSEKDVISFSHRRIGIGYNIIPESRWTQPERSDDPLETIYVDGISNIALYLQPFDEAEFNEAYYRGLLDPQDHSGREDRWIWAHFDAYSPASMVLVDLTSGDLIARIEERPYKVLQTPGPQLGYQVVEFQGEVTSTQRPTFVGFELILTNNTGRLAIKLLDTQGDIVQGSEREIRWLPQERPIIQYLWIGTPILVGILVLSWHKTSSMRIRK